MFVFVDYEDWELIVFFSLFITLNAKTLKSKGILLKLLISHTIVSKRERFIFSLANKRDRVLKLTTS